MRGVVIEGRYVAACWLHPQAINGLPPLNEVHLRTINQSAGWLKGEVSGWAREEGGELAARKLTPCALERRTELDYYIGLLCTDCLYGELFWSWTLDCTVLITDYGTRVNKNPLNIILLCVCLFFPIDLVAWKPHTHWPATCVCPVCVCMDTLYINILGT